jgi:hypothetical protein
MHISLSFLTLGATLFSLSNAAGLAPFDDLKTLSRDQLVRVFGDATPEERWTFFQDKYQNYLDERKDSLTQLQIEALNQAIKYTKTQDRTLENAVRTDLFDSFPREEAVKIMQVVPTPTVPAGFLMEREGGNYECSIGWPNSCQNSPIGPVCHLGEVGSPYECVPDISKPCATYPDGTVTYCDGFCGT